MLINSELRKENHIFLRTFRGLNREFCRNLRKKARLRQLLNEKSVVISIKKWDCDRFSCFFSLITCLQSSSHAYGLLWWRCLRVRNHMSAELVAAELLNSPARRSIGLSLTTSWVAEPCFCSFTPACMLMQHNNVRKDNTILFIDLHLRKGLKILETGIAPFLGVFQLYIE